MPTLDELRDALEARAEQGDATPAEASAAFRRAHREAVPGRRWRAPVLLAAAAVVLVVATIGIVVAATGGDDDGTDLITDTPSTTTAPTTTAPGPTTTMAATTRPRVVVSPLVEVSAYLTERADEDLFSVSITSDDMDQLRRSGSTAWEGGIWRLMALTDFDGEIWRRSSDFTTVTGPVGSDAAAGVPRHTVRQTITTSGLSNIYLPAAYEVHEVIDSAGVALEYEVATGALVVAADQPPAEITYTVESAVPDFGLDRPDIAVEGLADDFVAEHTRLPDAWPASLTERAREITARGDTDLLRAFLLETHFTAHSPSTYVFDPAASNRHGLTDIEALLEAGRGSPEQFASAFAAMARSLGLPARVAVGFTEGEWDGDREEFVVRGENAHVWPEIYYSGLGWTPYDPTPGRETLGVAPVDPTMVDLRASITTIDVGVEVAQHRPVVAAGSVWAIATDGPQGFGATDVVRIDPTSGTVVARIDPGARPVDVFAGDGAIWIQADDGTLHRIDPATNEIVTSIEVFEAPGGRYGGGAAAADAVWVTPGLSLGSGFEPQPVSMRRIDPGGDAIATFVELPGDPASNREVALGDDAVWVGGAAGVDRVDPATDEVVARIPLVTESDAAAMVADFASHGGGFRAARVIIAETAVWAVLPDETIRIDAATDQVVARIPVLVHDAVLVGEHLLIGAPGGIIYRIDTTTDSIDATFDLGPGSRPTPSHLAIVGNELWFSGGQRSGNTDNYYDTRFGRIPLDALTAPVG